MHLTKALPLLLHGGQIRRACWRPGVHLDIPYGVPDLPDDIVLKITPPAPDPAPEYPRPKPLGSPKAGGRKKASSTSPPSATEPSGDKMVATRNGTIAEKYSANSADLMASDWEEYKSGR